MINSTQWGSPGWWFLGGTEEPKDQADLAKTVRREVKEEIGASDGDDVVLDVHPLIGQCNDKRISGRYGVLTEYYYQLFSVRLRPEHSKIAPLLATDRPVVTIPYVPAMREHQLRWMTFDDVLNEPHLITHTPGIIAEMKRSLMPNMIVSSGNRT